jgi:hypothetical protein
MALALGDALAVVISNELHINVQAVFSQNHPGGAIGQAIKKPQKISDVAIRFKNIPQIGTGPISIGAMTGAHILMSAYRSKSGWVRHGNDLIASPSHIKTLRPGDDMDEPVMCIEGLMVASKEWISIPAETDLEQAKDWIKSMRRTSSSAEAKFGDDAILATIVDGEVDGVMEVGDLMA